MSQMTWQWDSENGVRPVYRQDRYDDYDSDRVQLSREEEEWLIILHASKGNDGLTDLCNRVKMYYTLGK